MQKNIAQIRVHKRRFIQPAYVMLKVERESWGRTSQV